MKALIEAKGLQLRAVQQFLRTNVAREHQLLQSCQPEVLMDWRLCRLADPDFVEPNMSYKEPTPVASVPRISQPAQLELTRCRGPWSDAAVVYSATSHCMLALIIALWGNAAMLFISTLSQHCSVTNPQ